MRAFTRPRLRPYLPDRRFLRRVLGGLMVLLRVGWRAGRKALRLATAPEKKQPVKGEKPEGEQPKKQEKRESVGDAVDRFGGGLLICGIAGAVTVGGIRTAWPHVAPYGPVLACVGMVGLVGAAWAAGPPSVRGEVEGPPPGEAPDESTMTREEAVRVALLRYLDVHTRGRNGIHLAELHERLTQTEAYAALSKAEVGPLLEANGVPTVRSLTVGGVSGRTGVRRADVLALLSPDPQTPPIVPSRLVSSFSDLGLSRLTLNDSRPSESGSEST